MRVLVVTQYFYPETFRVNNLCAELVSRGHQVEVLTGYPQYPQGKIYEGYGFHIPYEKEWNGIKIHRVKMRPRGKTPFGLLWNCYSFVREGNRWVKKCRKKFDAVYVFEVSPVTVGLPALTYKKKFGTPIYFHLQDLWPENVEHILGIKNKWVLKGIDKIVDKIYDGCDKILCTSKSFVRNLLERGVPEEKLEFWPQFCEKPDTTTEKPDCYSENEVNIVFAGNMGEAQGLELLLESAAEMKDAPVRWYLVGDGRARERLKKKAKELGVLDKVSFVGRVSEEGANRYVRFADCAWLSFMDNVIFDMTIPAKLQTYLACGTPILAAAGGESAELIRNCGCGVVTEKTPKAVTQGVETLLAMSLDEKNEMRNRCRQTFEDSFTKEKLVDQLEDMMGELGGRRLESTTNQLGLR